MLKKNSQLYLWLLIILVDISQWFLGLKKNLKKNIINEQPQRSTNKAILFSINILKSYLSEWIITQAFI